jgi:hypothetical protein
MGNLHDDQQHLGLKQTRSRLQIGTEPDPKPGGSSQPGGQFICNVDRQPDGQIQPEIQQRLHAIGDWLTLNGDSIYGTTYGPIQRLAGSRTTAKAKSIYLHVFDWTTPTYEIPDRGGE